MPRTPGRRPLPTALKLVTGNPGKRALPKDEPTPAAGAEMPEWLTPGAREHWPIVAKQLEEAGVLTRLDQVALAMYCETFARWRDANQKVATHGPIIKSKHGNPMQSPFLGIANKAFAQMQSLLIEFGMTPSSRTRVKVAGGGNPVGNPFDEFDD
jgi:P27 family predicted phage terminase small subunit